ncbi:DUF5359 family protein [Bacillus sp. JJ722]|uniref:DUF5359 family protein n=1 Tax=Bacillus sp. JJ722 TaxID=3122973 RepID=UPI002FFFEB13
MVKKVKKIEAIIVKLIIIQCIFLLFFQIVFHRADSFLELKKLAKYEGVYIDNYSLIADVLQNNVDK